MPDFRNPLLAEFYGHAFPQQSDAPSVTTADVLNRMPPPDPLSNPRGYVGDYLRRQGLDPSPRMAAELNRPQTAPQPNALSRVMEMIPPEVAFAANFLGPRVPVPMRSASARPRGFQPVEFTPEMREAARKGYLANESETVIADRVGVAIGTLRKHLPSILEEFGMQTRPRVGRYGPPPTQAEIQAAYESGATTTSALGQALGRSRGSGNRYLREIGLTPTDAPRRNADVLGQVQSLRRDGWSYGDIAQNLQLTRNTVAGMVRDLRAQGIAVPGVLMGILLSQGEGNQEGID